MKTHISFLTCILFVTVSCLKPDDFSGEKNYDLNLKSAETKTMNFRFRSGVWNSPLYCGDEFMDNLVGNDETLNSRGVVHFVDGKATWAHVMINGTVVRESTGEIFKINELDKLTFDENEICLSHKCRTPTKGNMGTNVIIFYTVLDFDLGEIVLDKAICTSN